MPEIYVLFKKDAFDMRDILVKGKLKMFSKLLLSSWETKETFLHL